MASPPIVLAYIWLQQRRQKERERPAAQQPAAAVPTAAVPAVEPKSEKRTRKKP